MPNEPHIRNNAIRLRRALFHRHIGIDALERGEGAV